MSLLDLHKRPTVIFDVTNAEHRKWYAAFARSFSWKNCPVQFIVQDKKGGVVGDAAAAMARQVTLYYINQEFKPHKSYYKRKTPAL